MTGEAATDGCREPYLAPATTITTTGIAAPNQE